MNRIIIFFVLFILTFINCKKSSTSTETDSETYVKVVGIRPATQSIISRQDTIFADISYSISEEHETDYGFKVGILFSSTNPNQSFCTGSYGQISIIDKERYRRSNLSFIRDMG